MRTPNVKIPNIEAPVVNYPKRTTLFGKPGEPLGTCSKCRRNFPIKEMQEIYIDSKTPNWYCPKCMYRRKLKESFAPRMG